VSPKPPSFPAQPIVNLYRCSRHNGRDRGMRQKLAADLGVSHRTLVRWIEDGIPMFAADRAAVSLGFHPSNVWLDWFEKISPPEGHPWERVSPFPLAEAIFGDEPWTWSELARVCGVPGSTADGWRTANIGPEAAFRAATEVGLSTADIWPEAV